MVKEEITLDNESNRIFANIVMDDKEVYDILCNRNTGERIDIIKRSIKIGVMALKNATITVDTNYIQKELERLISDIDSNLKKNLGKEGMKGELEKTFGEKGYLENKLKEILKEHDKTMADVFREDNVNSPLYKIRRLMEDGSRRTEDNVYDMLDPGNKDSLMSRLKEEIVRKIDDIKKSGDIDTVNKSIEAIQLANMGNNDVIRKEIQGFRDDYNNKFTDVRKSIHEEIGNVAKVVTDTNIELAKIVKERQVVDTTTLKGMKFEDIIFQFLATKAISKYGDTVDVINLSGGDKAGDIIINIKGSQEKIIVKAESTSKENVQMPDTILKHLNNSMKERSAGYGIKVYENELPEKIGPVLVGDNKIICSYLSGYAFEGYPLEVAYEVLRTSILRKGLGINREDVKQHIDNIVRLMNSLQHISGNLSKMENLCENTKAQIEELRKNVSGELDQILSKDKDESKEESKSEGKDENKEVDKPRARKTKHHDCVTDLTRACT